MASAIIHLAVAKKIKNSLNIKNENEYFLGAIAPDLSKQIGESKRGSHFLYDNSPNVPDIKKFVNKYPNFTKNEFNLGYFIHLYTDKIWFENYLNILLNYNSIKLLDGSVIPISEEKLSKLVYSDYTNLNIQIIDKYNLDLKLFYEDFKKPVSSISEIDTNKLNILIDKMGIIIANSKTKKNYIFDIFSIEKFINHTTNEILKYLKDNKCIN